MSIVVASVWSFLAMACAFKSRIEKDKVIIRLTIYRVLCHRLLARKYCRV
jgi:hypothetical protein